MKKKKIILGTLITLLMLPLLAAGVLYTITNPKFAIDGWADMDSAILSRFTEVYTVADKYGNDTYRISSSGNSIAIYDDIPKHTVNAFIAAEDKRFYTHKGVDYYRILGAAASNIKNFGLKEGASTITQQLVKNTHLSAEKTMTRKLKEVRIAREVEQSYTKEEIMAMYLNALYFGHNIYGISDASRYYFGKTVSGLSLSESAVLAATINNPSTFDPVTNPENNEKRRNLILHRMREQDLISDDELSAALSEAVTTSSRHVFPQYQYFVMSQNTDKAVRINSFLDPAMQTISENALANAQLPDVLASIVILDVNSGNIAAATANITSDITEVVRQPGSVIKPIICYAPALEDNLITPITQLNDAPTDFGGYSPSNYNNRFYGWQTAEKCLSYSLNVPAVKLLEMNGIKRSKNFARKLGMKISDEDNGLAIALGGLKNGVSLYQLADAYAAFARGGKYTTSRAAVSAKRAEKVKVMHDDTAYFINKMLSSCAKSGTARTLRDIENIAAKTGTVGVADGNTDAYCVAYNESYVTAVWIGAPSGVMPDGITGGGMPAEICAEIMKNPALSSGAFTKPSSVVTLDVDLIEYEKNHRLVLANESYAIKDRLSAQFSLRNLPARAKIEKKSGVSDGENFKIVDNFSD